MSSVIISHNGIIINHSSGYGHGSHGYGFGYHHVATGTSSTSMTNQSSTHSVSDSLGFLTCKVIGTQDFPLTHDHGPHVSRQGTRQGTQPPTFPNQKLPKVIYFLKMNVKNKGATATVGGQPGKISRCKVAQRTWTQNTLNKHMKEYT